MSKAESDRTRAPISASADTEICMQTAASHTVSEQLTKAPSNAKPAHSKIVEAGIEFIEEYSDVFERMAKEE